LPALLLLVQSENLVLVTETLAPTHYRVRSACASLFSAGAIRCAPKIAVKRSVWAIPHQLSARLESLELGASRPLRPGRR